jgi:hypothetical protein
MTDFEQAVLDKLERIATALEAYALQEKRTDMQTPEQEAVPALTDEECLQRAEETGFIEINTRITHKVCYMVKAHHTVLEVFDLFAKMTGSEKRARALMFQRMSGVKSTLDRYRQKKSLKT